MPALADLSALGACVLLAGCGPAREQPPPSPPVTPASPAAASSAPDALPLSTGPITFFENQCARCHGSYGAQYGEALRALADADLARFVDEMIVGPGMASLPPADVAAQVAYHRSMVDGRPFLAITSRNGASIGGEVTPGAAVTVLTPAGRVVAEVTGHTWRGSLAPGAAPTAVEAVSGTGSTTLDLGAGTYSHPSR